jgi:hypothetical protein
MLSNQLSIHIQEIFKLVIQQFYVKIHIQLHNLI